MSEQGLISPLVATTRAGMPWPSTAHPDGLSPAGDPAGVQQANSTADEHSLSLQRLANHLAKYDAPAALQSRVRELCASRTIDAVETASKPLEEIAVDNAVNGTVRESWDALQYTWKAHYETDKSLAWVFRTLAMDLTKRVQARAEVHEWLMSQLPADARVRVQEARAEALQHALSTADAPVPAALVKASGLPLHQFLAA